MKCLCGFENKHGEWDPETRIVVDEPAKDSFIKVIGTFLRE